MFRAIVGWNGDLGYIIRVHGQEFNSFGGTPDLKRYASSSCIGRKKFLCVCDTLHMWEWDVRVLDIQDCVEGDHTPVCVGGRSAAPPILTRIPEYQSRHQSSTDNWLGEIGKRF